MTHRASFPTRLAAGMAVAASLLLLAATPAAAYVGPGAGLSLLTALWGVAAAVVAALAFVIIWPVRRMVKRRSARPDAGSQERVRPS